MVEAIAAGIAAKQLHSHWADWKGEGDVAVAVRLDAASVSGSRLYTYLPMGDQAEAPFAGFLSPRSDSASTFSMANGAPRLAT